MNPHRTLSISGPSGCVVACVIACVAGCSSNPFAVVDSDYARRAAMERLRSLPSDPLGQYRVPAEALTGPEARATIDTVLASVRASRERFVALGSFSLSIEECRKSALEHNLDLKVALVDPAIARERVTEEDNRFNAAFTLRADYADAQFPSSSRLSSASSKTLNFNPGLRIPTRTGGQVGVDLLSSRSETNNEFTTLNPAYESDLRLTLSHPLMRNAGRRVTTAPLRVAGYDEQASGARTALEAINQVTGVERAYWNLYQSKADLDVRLQQFDIAKQQLDRAERRVKEGIASDVEIDRAKAGAAQRLEAIVLAQNSVLLRQRELKRIINLPGLDVDTKVLIDLTTAPDPVRYEFDADKLQRFAVENRMELLELQLRLAADAVQIGVDRNRLLPLVDMQFQYRLNGLGDGYGKALETTAEAQFPDWNVGINAEVPLDNGEARARLRRSLLTHMQRLSNREARERAIRREVLDAVDALDSGWQRILAAQQAVVTAVRALGSEQRQYELGKSTSNFVLDAASNLGDAQLAEVRALVDYQLAQADLAFATGTVLGASKVSIEPVAPPDITKPDPAE